MVANIHYFVLGFSLNRMAGLISFCVCPPSPLKGGLSLDILELFLTPQLRPPLGGRPPPAGGGRGALHTNRNTFRGCPAPAGQGAYLILSFAPHPP